MWQVGFSKRRVDPLATRNACIALKHLAAAKKRPSEARLRPAYAALAQTAAGPAGLPEAGWYSAAEAAITAIYALHPRPTPLCEAVLRLLGRTALVEREPALGISSLLLALLVHGPY